MINSAGAGPDSVASSLDVLQLRLRSTAALSQKLCNTGSEHCRVCMQKTSSLRAAFCSSRAAEEGSGIFWTMVGFTYFVVEFQA